MNESIIFIQRQYRLYQLKKIMNILKFDKDIIKRKNFDEFTKLIQSKNILNIVRLLLTKITRISNYSKENPLTSQAFLTSFLFYGYPDDVINNESEEINKFNDSIISISNIIIKLYNSLMEKATISKVINFYNKLIEYNNTFEIWKDKDKQELLHDLTIIFYKIESIILLINSNKTDELDDKKEQIDICREQQDNIVGKILFLNGMDYFNNYRPPKSLFEENIKKRVHDTIYEVYWNILKEELDADPPVYNQLLKILEELRDLFCEFVIDNERTIQEIHDNIDIDLIKNMLINDAFDESDLFKLTTYMISLVKRFQPPVMDDDVCIWEESMLEYFKKKFQYSDFLIIFFQSIFNMIYSIVLYIEELKEKLENMENVD